MRCLLIATILTGVTITTAAVNKQCLSETAALFNNNAIQEAYDAVKVGVSQTSFIKSATLSSLNKLDWQLAKKNLLSQYKAACTTNRGVVVAMDHYSSCSFTPKGSTRPSALSFLESNNDPKCLSASCKTREDYQDVLSQIDIPTLEEDGKLVCTGGLFFPGDISKQSTCASYTKELEKFRPKVVSAFTVLQADVIRSSGIAGRHNFTGITSLGSFNITVDYSKAKLGPFQQSCATPGGVFATTSFDVHCIKTTKSKSEVLLSTVFQIKSMPRCMGKACKAVSHNFDLLEFATSDNMFRKGLLVDSRREQSRWSCSSTPEECYTNKDGQFGTSITSTSTTSVSTQTPSGLIPDVIDFSYEIELKPKTKLKEALASLERAIVDTILPDLFPIKCGNRTTSVVAQARLGNSSLVGISTAPVDTVNNFSTCQSQFVSSNKNSCQVVNGALTITIKSALASSKSTATTTTTGTESLRATVLQLIESGMIQNSSLYANQGIVRVRSIESSSIETEGASCFQEDDLFAKLKCLIFQNLIAVAIGSVVLILLLIGCCCFYCIMDERAHADKLSKVRMPGFWGRLCCRRPELVDKPNCCERLFLGKKTQRVPVKVRGPGIGGTRPKIVGR